MRLCHPFSLVFFSDIKYFIVGIVCECVCASVRERGFGYHTNLAVVCTIVVDISLFLGCDAGLAAVDIMIC